MSVVSGRSALGRHGQKQDGLLARAGFRPALVLARSLQSHVPVRVFPGSVRVVVVRLQAFQEITFICCSSLRETETTLRHNVHMHKIFFTTKYIVSIKICVFLYIFNTQTCVVHLTFHTL